jgi:hypothetical protein
MEVTWKGLWNFLSTCSIYFLLLLAMIPFWDIFAKLFFLSTAGSYVTHETNYFVYFYIDSKAVLLFKSGWLVQPSGHLRMSTSECNLLCPHFEVVCGQSLEAGSLWASMLMYQRLTISIFQQCEIRLCIFASLIHVDVMRSLSYCNMKSRKLVKGR